STSTCPHHNYLYTLSLHDAHPISIVDVKWIGTVAIEVTYKDTTGRLGSELLYRDRELTLEIARSSSARTTDKRTLRDRCPLVARSEEHTSELQSRENLVCRLLLEK